MCGGELLIVTCSHVGHVFRKSTPYTFPGGTSYIVNRYTQKPPKISNLLTKNKVFKICLNTSKRIKITTLIIREMLFRNNARLAEVWMDEWKVNAHAY